MAGRRTVVLVGPTPPPYQGMAVFTEMLLRSEELHGAYEVLHLDTADRRPVENMGRVDVTNVVLALRHAAQLAGLVLRHRPELVYIEVAQNEWAYLRDAVLMAIARAAGCRLVTHLHGSNFRNFYEATGPVWRWLIRRTSRWLDAAAVLGDNLRCLYRGLVPEARVHVAPNGIEDPFPDGVERSVASVADGPLTVTYLGLLSGRKGVLELLRAVARLTDAEPPIRTVVAGAWATEEDRDRAMELVDRYGLEEFVTFPGVVTGEDKWQLLRDTDIFVFPGRQPEGLPLVILEAMAAGLPVIATDRGAIRDAVSDGQSGVILDDGDAVELSRAIRTLSRAPDVRARMGRAGRQRFLASFTAGRCAEQLVDVFDAVCAREPEARR